MIYLFDRFRDFGQQNGHVFYFLDEDVLIGSFLIGIHFILDLIDRKDLFFDVDIIDESANHVFQDVLGGLGAFSLTGAAVSGGDFKQSGEEGVALGGSEADF